MSNGDIAELARKIYFGHKELIDEIIQHKPDAAAEFKNILERKALEKGYVLGSPNKGYLRVLTPALYEIIPRGLNKDWSLKESFAFEIDFLWAKGYGRVYCNVPPGDDEARNVLKHAFESLSSYKKPWGEKWLSYCISKTPLDLERLMTEDIERADQMADKLISMLDEMVAEVEPAILVHSDALKSIIAKRSQN